MTDLPTLAGGIITKLLQLQFGVLVRCRDTPVEGHPSCSTPYDGGLPVKDLPKPTTGTLKRAEPHRPRPSKISLGQIWVSFRPSFAFEPWFSIRRRNHQTADFFEVLMVRRAGLEPATHGLKGRCSTN
jgi:hypothetical protein